MNQLALGFATITAAALLAIPAAGRAAESQVQSLQMIELHTTAPLVRPSGWDGHDWSSREREHERWEERRREEARARAWHDHHHEEYGYGYRR